MSAITKSNEDFFDSFATKYNTQEWQKKLTLQMRREILDRLDWIGVDWLDPAAEGSTSKQVRLFDYACGPGSISQTLAPYTSSIIGADLSANMVETYNTAVSNQGLSSSDMRAIKADLLSLPEPSAVLQHPEYFDFDIATCGFAFHHFDDADLAAKRLVERVKRGTGRVLIVDFEPHAHLQGQIDAAHGHGHGHSHGHGNGQGHGHGHGHGHDHSHAHGGAAKGQQEGLGSHEHTDGLGGGLSDEQYRAALASSKTSGFSEEEIRGVFERAGCVDVKIEILGKGATIVAQGKKIERKVFMLVGTRRGD